MVEIYRIPGEQRFRVHRILGPNSNQELSTTSGLQRSIHYFGRTFTQHFYCILPMNDIHWVKLFYLKLRRFDSEITLHLCILPLKVSVSQNIIKY